MNSFRFLERGVRAELDRQVALLERGAPVVQETLHFDPTTRSAGDRLTSLRSKEEAHDYRYFPEPDLVPLVVSDEMRDALGARLPELPVARARALGARARARSRARPRARLPSRARGLLRARARVGRRRPRAGGGGCQLDSAAGRVVAQGQQPSLGSRSGRQPRRTRCAGDARRDGRRQAGQPRRRRATF